LEEAAIFDAAPAVLLGSGTVVAGQQPVHRPRHTLIPQDSHAATGSSKASSERSKIRRAISRVTDGKHSRNSSSE